MRKRANIKTNAQLAKVFGFDQGTLSKCRKDNRWSPLFADLLRAYAKRYGFADEPLAVRGDFINIDEWKPEPTATAKLDLLIEGQKGMVKEQKRIADLLEEFLRGRPPRQAPD